MKKLYCLLATFLICGFSGMAKADDFHMVVLDPFVGGTYSVDSVLNLSTPLQIKFSDCEEPDQIPLNPDDTVNTTYDGCFTFRNDTGLILNSLTIMVDALIPTSTPGVNQTAGCALSGLLMPGSTTAPLDIFNSPTCTDGPSSYTLNFTGGSIGLGEYVTIAESGVDPSAFPATTGTLAVTPEPGSLLLLSTGTVALGSFFNRRRRGTDATDHS